MATAAEPVGRVAVVTGGSSGIGEAIARELYALGDRVAIVSRDPRRGEAVARALGPRAVHLAADLAVPEEIRALPARVEQALGRASVLVNNAGIYRQGDAATTSEETWQEIMRVNLDAPFLLVKAFLPHLTAAAGGGAVVNVASEAGLRAIRNQVAYNVSKAALVALTRSLAVDLAPLGVRVNAACPGTTMTPLVREVIERAPDPARTQAALEGVRPMNRLGDPAETARAVAFLASPAVGYMTGAVLAVDGGFSA